MNILVVDDLKTNRRLLRAMLEGEGSEIFEAVDGLEALEILEKVAIDAIISDILMPRMDGYRLCQAVRQHRYLFDLPFIFYTSTYTSESDAAFAAIVGGDRFLKKPVSAATMRITLEEVCAPRKTSRAKESTAELEVDVLRHYNERLVHKLEQKNEDLSRSRERLQALVENIDGVVWEGRPDTFEITFISAQIERLLGFPVESWLSGPAFWQSRVHPDDLERVQAIASEWRKRPIIHLEFRFLDARGNIVWLHNATSIIGEPEAPRACGLLIDITERKDLEAQLLQAQKMEAVGRLAAGVAHDFNNLLSVIQLHLGVMLAGEVPEELRGGLELVDEETRRAVRLTRQLLTISRKQNARLVQVDLNRLVLGLTSLLRRLLSDEIRLEQVLDPSAPCVFADSGLLEQVLLNLVVNARDAMPTGGRIVLRTAAIDAGGSPAARLSVSDDGAGIPPEILSKIFEPFFTTKDSELGTGLGLSTVAAIVEQHQGRIEVESTEGEGTTFHVWLPTCQPITQVPEAPPPAALAPAGAGQEGILLVEDQESLRAIVASILRRLGYQVFEAVSGIDALEIWWQHRREIDLLFTDMMMPDGMTGWDLAARLTTDRPEVRVLITSGHGFNELEPHFKRPDHLHFLQKPYSASTLGLEVRRCLDA